MEFTLASVLVLVVVALIFRQPLAQFNKQAPKIVSTVLNTVDVGVTQFNEKTTSYALVDSKGNIERSNEAFKAIVEAGLIPVDTLYKYHRGQLSAEERAKVEAQIKKLK